MMIFTRTILLLTSLLLSAPLLADKPQRIVSLGLCTDQMLLQMVEPERIVALSNMATHPTMSFMADTAKKLGKPEANLESIIELQPDLIIGTRYSRPEVLRILTQLGYPVRTVELPQRYQQIPAMILEMGEWLGEKEHAEKLVAGMQTTLNQARHSVADKKPVKALIFSPNGYTIGRDTIENDVMKLAGYSNLAEEMNITGFKKIPLEKLVTQQPDIIFIDSHIENKHSLANQLLTHPLLAKISKEKPRRFIPSHLRACAGNMTANAVEYLVSKR